MTDPEQSFATVLERDLIRKVDAGAYLTYALYHAPVEWLKTAPGVVLHAIARAQAAYAINRELP